MSPLLSVAVVFYNLEAYAKECVESILARMNNSVELLMIDDGSSDGTTAILSAFLGPDNIVLVRQKNQGVSAARNTAITRARGKYIWFVDGDDWLNPNAIDSVCDHLRKASPGVSLIVGSESISPAGDRSEFGLKPAIQNQHREALGLYLSGKIRYVLWNKIVEREPILNSGVLFPIGRKMEELAFMAHYYSCNSKIKVIPEVLYHYRIRAGSTITSGSPSNYSDTAYAADCIFETLSKKQLLKTNRLDFALLIGNLLNARYSEILSSKRTLQSGCLHPLDRLPLRYKNNILLAAFHAPLRVAKFTAKLGIKRLRIFPRINTAA